jgi:hypothetical protein
MSEKWVRNPKNESTEATVLVGESAEYYEQRTPTREWMKGFFEKNPEGVLAVTMFKNENGGWETIPLPEVVTSGKISPHAFLSECVRDLHIEDRVHDTEESNQLNKSIQATDNGNFVKIWRSSVQQDKRIDPFPGTVMEGYAAEHATREKLNEMDKSREEQAARQTKAAEE